MFNKLRNILPAFFRKNGLTVMVVVISFLLCLMVLLNVILPGDVFHWDESHHSLYIGRNILYIRHGDWDAFWKETHHQTGWPFFHSWVITFLILPFGVHHTTLRAANLFLFFLIILGTFLTGRALDKEKGKWIGLIAWFLVITSYLLWSLGSQNMTEALGGVLTIYGFYFLLRLYQTKKWNWIILLGLSMAFCIVTKYNYALFLIAGVATWALYDFIPVFYFRMEDQSAKKESKKKSLEFKKRFSIYILKYSLIILPSIIMFYWWFFGPNMERKWAYLAWSREVTVLTHHQVPGFMNNMIFYFKSLILDYTWFPLLGGLVVIGLFGILYLIRKKDPIAIMLAAFAWVPMLLSIFLIWGKEHRFIYTFVPIIFLCAAYFAVYLLEELRKAKPALTGNKFLKIAVIATLILMIFFQGRPMVEFFLGRYPDTYRPQKIEGEGTLDVLNYFSEKVPLDAPIAFIINYGFFNPYNIEFHFSLRKAPEYRIAPTYNMYGSPRSFHSGMYLLTIEVDDDSRYRKSLAETPDDSLEKWNAFIKNNLNYLELVDTKYFDKLGLKALAYKIK